MDLKVSSAKYRSFRLNVLRVQSSVILFFISLGASQLGKNNKIAVWWAEKTQTKLNKTNQQN